MMASICPMRLLLTLSALSLIPLSSAYAELAADVNSLRSRGCEGRAGLQQPLESSRTLNEVAREWSRGGRLREAIKRTDYRVVSSSSMHVQGAKSDAAILKVLADNYCSVILDPAFNQIGVHRQNDEVWIVVATPFTAPSPGSSAEISSRALQLVNAARAQQRKCGRTLFRPAPPLTLNPALERAALAHAKDMANHSLFEHRGSDGSQPADRVTRSGYKWRTVGENIAAGAADIDTVVQGWIDSPGHCTNIMGPQYKEMGIAFFVNPKSQADIYWSQVFATKR
jgi:uncharacterized protein YkwD